MYRQPVTARRIPNINSESHVMRIIETVRSIAQDSYRANMNTFHAFGKEFTIVVIDRDNAHVECGGKDCGIRIIRGIAELDRR